MNFKKIISDGRLHILLFSLILILLGTNFYFFWLSSSPGYLAAQEELLLPNIYRLKEEQALQDTVEKVQPESVHVPILIYHSVHPHTPNEISVVRYYDVAPTAFEKQLQYLKDNNYAVISSSYLAEALEKNITLLPKTVIINFDDGWKNQYKYAFPLLKKYGYTATFFLPSDMIGHGSAFMTWDQVKDLDNAGMEIGGHTRTHPYLPTIDSQADLISEIKGGKTVLESQLGHPIFSFAYPFGHYNDNIISVVKKAGFTSARSTYKGVYNSLAEIYKLKGVEATDDFAKFVENVK